MNFLLSTSPIKFPGLGFEINPSDGFSIAGFEIKWYGVIIACATVLAAIYILSRVKEFGVTQDDILNCMLIGIPCGIIGARAYYVIFEWKYFFGPNNNWYDCLMIRDGGLAIYGGIIGAALSIGLFLGLSKKRRRMLPTIFDLTGLALLIGQFLGRWGNFFNREAHGSECTNFLRMELFENGTWTAFHPTFLYESVWNFVGFILLHFASKKRKFDGEIFLLYVAWYGLGRSFIESLRTDSLYWGPLRISQWVGAVTCALSLLLWIYFRFFAKKKPLLVERVAKEQAALMAFSFESSEEETADASEEEVNEEETEALEETAGPKEDEAVSENAADDEDSEQ